MSTYSLYIFMNDRWIDIIDLAVRVIFEILNREIGWGSKFGTTKCRTADISRIWNFEYRNNESRVIWFFYFQIYFLYLRLFELFEHLKYMIIYEIEIFWNFESFTNCQMFKIC